jgi:response regulator RpfG family c-di-GMP phosphodiesterase
MSSVRLSEGPSPADSPAELSLVSLLRVRGAPLLDGLEAHLPGSREEAEGASSYAFAAAVELGLGRLDAELVRETTKLHDVGRVYVPADVVAKPATSRTPEEAAQAARAHELGAQLARGAGLPERVCEWIRFGAERYDGGGPGALAGKEIPLQARIARAAHACFAALTRAPNEDVATGRPDPVSVLWAAAGGELDPLVVDALESVLARAQAG